MVKSIKRLLAFLLTDNFTHYLCSKGCQSDEFTCSNGQCIPDNEECDGNSDCNDNSDEHSNCGI